MRRIVLIGIATMLLTTGCAQVGPGGTAAPPPQGSTAAGATRDADIHTAVLRRYLTNPSENSFPGFTFPVVYVLDRTDAGAADPMDASGPAAGSAISADDQQRIVAALRDVGNIRFVSSRNEVVVNSQGCEQVRDGGILISLASPKGSPDRVEVGINGFVACLGATWLTYVVQRESDGWIVTGTTGPIAVA